MFSKLSPADVMVLLGAHNLSNSFESGRINAVVSKIEIHNEWNPHTISYDADIAMLTLDDAVHFTRYVKPICLPDSTVDLSFLTGDVAGWGKTNAASSNTAQVPSQLKLQIHTNEICFLTHKDLVDISSTRTFCAGNRTEASVCHGDSGSGFYVEHDNRFYFYGIVSSSLTTNLGTCDVAKHAVYTKVSSFKDWIARISNSNKITSVPTTQAPKSIQTLPENYQPCLTPNGVQGFCQPFKTCASLYNIFLAKPISTSDQNLLRQSKCNKDVKPWVCCASTQLETTTISDYVDIFAESKPEWMEVLEQKLPKVCGLDAQNRVVGGEETQLTEFPWIVLLKYEKGEYSL